MKLSFIAKLVVYSTLGSFGLVTLLGGMATKAAAQTVPAGCDSWMASSWKFAKSGTTTVNLVGLPIGGAQGSNDNVVCRDSSVMLPGKTSLTMSDLLQMS